MFQGQTLYWPCRNRWNGWSDWREVHRLNNGSTIYITFKFSFDRRLTRNEGEPDSNVHGANMGPTWVLSALNGPHVGPMNLAIRGCKSIPGWPWWSVWTYGIVTGLTSAVGMASTHLVFKRLTLYFRDDFLIVTCRKKNCMATITGCSYILPN